MKFIDRIVGKLDKIEDKVNTIDKVCGITATNLKALTMNFGEHKKEEGLWQTNIEKDLGSCPEAPHIKDQNGAIADLTKEVSNTRGQVKVWAFIIAALIVVIGIGSVIANLWK